MEIHDILAPDSVLTSVRATSKKQALQELSKQASQVTGLHDRTIFDVLLERERLGTTGVGRGIAIPHGKLPELDRLHGIFAVLEQPIEFDSVDDQPVDLIFLLLAPESAGADHLKALARVSRLLRDSNFCDRLRAAANPGELFDALTHGTAPHAV
jgi:PTS system nitrogen regulatory IIA component